MYIAHMLSPDALQMHRKNLVGPLYNWILLAKDYSPDQLMLAGEVFPGDRVIIMQPNHVAWSNAWLPSMVSTGLYRNSQCPSKYLFF